MESEKLEKAKQELNEFLQTGDYQKYIPSIQIRRKIEPIKVEPKIGRNEKCYCGSNLKYKHCHGK